MEGNKRVDELMLPVLNAINRHVKDRDAKTDIYNRAYEALLISMDVNAALREQVRWIPVSERLPEYGKAVLVMTTTSVLPRIGRHSPTISQWATTDLLYYHDISYSQVTHWMPLPKPPDECHKSS